MANLLGKAFVYVFRSMTTTHRYGRGKFQAHPRYIDYMRFIVEHPNYRTLPNAVGEGGRINWQVSSGRTTSFFKFYDARAEWWVFEADRLAVPGRGRAEGRFAVAARLIHPTGFRACRLCGEDRDIGYVYLNHHGARRLNRATDTLLQKWQHVGDVAALADTETLLAAELRSLFPERARAFDEFGLTEEAFEQSRHLDSNFLSPGFMANPPDRLDGFHDYCLFCRGTNDPGRSVANLRTYAHDRRAFEYWAEGDWGLADALYNVAGRGKCERCGVLVPRVSPDHVGPLACGFKQLPLFRPTCQPCNSAKNRRMRLEDIHALIAFEEATKQSVASWQVRGQWDRHKRSVVSDADAVELSASMRAVQDVYLRTLHSLLEGGQARFLSTLLSPEFAFYSHTFTDLDPSQLTYAGVESSYTRTRQRDSLARRSVRIAFDELRAYSSKPSANRRMRLAIRDHTDRIVSAALVQAAALERTELDELWNQAVTAGNADLVEAGLAPLLSRDRSGTGDADLRHTLATLFNGLDAEGFFES